MKRKLSILLIVTMIVSMFTLGGCGVSVTPAEDFEYEVYSDGAAITKYKGDSDKVRIPETIDNYIVTRIDSEAFLGCALLKEVIIPDTVTIIDSNAFAGCKGLTNITIPDSVTKIGEAAFLKCSGLTEITVGKGLVEYVGNGAFAGCENVKKVTFDSERFLIEQFYGETTYRYHFNRYFSEDFPELNELVIGDNITDTDELYFKDCKKLSKITLPDTLTDWTYATNMFDCENAIFVYKGNEYNFYDIDEVVFDATS